MNPPPAIALDANAASAAPLPARALPAQPPHVPPLERGARLWDRSTVRQHIHRSGDADLYIVWDDELQCECVAKCVRADLVEYPGPNERVSREGELLMRLRHPHIVRALATHQAPTGILLETIPGETLLTQLQREGDLPWRSIATLGLQLCSALHYLHSQGWVHVDVKPANVLRFHEYSTLIDFNVSRTPGIGIKDTGTRYFMAPEQVFCEHVGPPADVWGLGMTLYNASTGRLPFEGEEQHPQVHHEARPVRSLRNMPRELSRAIDGCIQIDPAQRLTTAQLSVAFREVIAKLDRRVQ